MEQGDAIGRGQGDKIGDAQGDIQGDGGFERLRRCIEIESSGAVKTLFPVDAGVFSSPFSIRLLRLGACFWNLGLSSCFCFTLQTYASYSEHLGSQSRFRAGVTCQPGRWIAPKCPPRYIPVRTQGLLRIQAQTE